MDAKCSRNASAAIRSGTQLGLYRARRLRHRLAPGTFPWRSRGRAAGGGWLALQFGDLTRVFIALSLALVLYGMINALAGEGACFDRD
jgi:hypothetical protein